MFYGIEVKSSQSKPIVLETSVKLTQAVLEPGKNGKKEPVSLIVETEKKRFILCVLDPSLSWQCPLDLVFSAGTELKFLVNGTGTVHLTGYETIDDLDDLEMSMSSDSEGEEGQIKINGHDEEEEEDDDDDEEEDEDTENEIAAKVKATARKIAATKGKVNGRVPVKRNVPPEELDGEGDDDDESDDSDFDADDLDSDEDEFDDEEDDEVDIDESLDDEDGNEDEDMEDDDEDDD